MSVPSHPGHNLVPATIAEVERLFPEAPASLDYGYPRLASAGDLVFCIRPFPAGSPPRPCPTVFAYSLATTPAEREQVVGWWKYRGTEHPVYLGARWDVIFGVWVRVSDWFAWRPGARKHERDARAAEKTARRLVEATAAGFRSIGEHRAAGSPQPGERHPAGRARFFWADGRSDVGAAPNDGRPIWVRREFPPTFGSIDWSDGMRATARDTVFHRRRYSYPEGFAGPRRADAFYEDGYDDAGSR